LGPAYGDIIPNDKELDLVYLGRMLCREFLLCETKVEHISRIVSSENVGAVTERVAMELT
jgi:hypothetical protein